LSKEGDTREERGESLLSREGRVYRDSLVESPK
jgi:hypothetical protein